MISFNLEFFIRMFRTFVDILAVWILIYMIISTFRKNMRTQQLFKGIIVIAFIKLLTSVLGLQTLDGIVNTVLTWGVLAIIIIFHPEIRGILEKIGRTTNELDQKLTGDERDKIVNELVNAISTFSKTKTGCLITFERRQSLQDFINTGIKFECEIKNELLQTIFYEGTPLHDGATIIKNDRIVSSACFYPPTNKDVPSHYGARHRAAIGISEITDSLTIIVSEETGNISFAKHGEIIKINSKELRAQLLNELSWQVGESEIDE